MVENPNSLAALVTQRLPDKYSRFYHLNWQEHSPINLFSATFPRNWIGPTRRPKSEGGNILKSYLLSGLTLQKTKDLTNQLLVKGLSKAAPDLMSSTQNSLTEYTRPKEFIVDYNVYNVIL